MMRTPEISVIMSVYNCRGFLAEAIESVLNQSFSDFEFLILNDGSDDGSGEIIDDYRQRDSRILAIEHRSSGNRGLAQSLNELLHMARGDFVARMDADDVCLPQRFAKQREFLLSRPDVVAVGSQCDVIDAAGNRVGRISRSLTHDGIERRFVDGGGGIIHPAAMIRNNRLVEIGGYDESLIYAQDLDLFLRLGELGSLANLPDVLLRYRWHPGQISVGKRSQQLACVAQTLAKAGRRRGTSMRHEIKEIYGELSWRLRVEGKRLAAFRNACRLVCIDPKSIRGYRYMVTSLLAPARKLDAVSVLPEGYETVQQSNLTTKLGEAGSAHWN